MPVDSPFEGKTSDALASMRRQYAYGALDREDLGADPIAAFDRWFAAAAGAGVDEPHAMILATVDELGHPDARAVLLKGLDVRGFVWFTSYDSAKGRQLEHQTNAALVFRWAPFERQVRVRGVVTMTSPDESDAYFNSRPYGSRLSAAASPQSRVVADRTVLEDEVALLATRHPENNPVARPSNWGGYRLAPTSIEFWQGRLDRLHDRIRFDRPVADPGTPWKVVRLAP